MTTETNILLTQALVEGPRGRLTADLQACSPSGLASAAISALHRGEEPPPRERASLDAALSWWEAWDSWDTAYARWSDIRSRTEATILGSAATRLRAETAHLCLAFYGGPLGDAAESDAALALRDAFAQQRGVGSSDAADLRGMLPAMRHEIRRDIREDEVISPDGLRFGDFTLAGARDLPVEPLVAAWAHAQPRRSLHRAARRWATAAAQPLLDAELVATEAAAAAASEFTSTDPVDVIGADAIAALLVAAEAADRDGVRLAGHQQDTVAAFRSAWSAARAPLAGIDI